MCCQQIKIGNLETGIDKDDIVLDDIGLGGLLNLFLQVLDL